MSLKDLFGKTSETIVVDKKLDKLYEQAESEGYIEEVIEDKERFLPVVDFSTASNFARYGSAERYYVDSIKNIYENYPYDGSKKEKQEWRNNSSLLDLHIFDNVYPRTVGYLNLNSATITNSGIYRTTAAPQYVKIKGGPNSATINNSQDANIYDITTNRESNLCISSFGNTVEFWFKDGLSTTSSVYNNSYCVFDLWNGITASSADYTRLSISKINGLNKFSVVYRSGSAGVTNQTIDYTFDPSVWHHYAFTFSNKNTNDLEISLYVDGNLQTSLVATGGGNIQLANNLGNIAYIGALRADLVSSDTSKEGYGVSSALIDEFRFWKIARNSQQIYRNWFTQVAGGNNTDDVNRDLGVYLKFNEGIVDSQNINDLDKICLDSAGRASNGTIINYNLNVRNTGSAIDQFYDKKDIYGNSVTVEPKDPIIFSENPLIQDAITTYGDIGIQHDNQNPTSIIKSIPFWITERAEEQNLPDLNYLIQIISSYFDTLHLQIESLPKIKNVNYDSSAVKPKPFAKFLLSSNAFDNLEIFNDTTFLESVLSRNESSQFENTISNVKNTIYQNIYNNLSYIYKSKGTEKSLRNLIRCFGIDDELVKINVYANNSEYTLDTKYNHTSVTKKFVDFNNPDRTAGVVYQYPKTGDSNTKGYIPGTTFNSASYMPLTVQAEIIFPKDVIIESSLYNQKVFTTSSLFGIHEANNNPATLSWGSDVFNFQVYSIRNQIGSEDAYFNLIGSFNGQSINLTSSIFKNVYDNQKWNFAVRIRQKEYQYAGIISGSDNTDYLVEFVGINSIGDSVSDQFIDSASVPKADMITALQANKRVYAGAHYQDFNTGILLTKSDVKISSVRFWLDYLTDEELKAHSFEANNFGRQQPNWMPEFYSSFSGSQPTPLTRMDMLALHWNFFNVTGTDGSGQFIVEDVSSGSAESYSGSYGYNWINEMIRFQMPGVGKAFLENDSQVVNKEYVFSGKKQNPETLSGNDLIQILNTDDITRTKESKSVSYYISIEKSMAQVINDEIMNWFATIKAYNNLIGSPVERYKQEYDGLIHLRELFFKQVNNRLNFEKFLTFYKWIDSSLSMMINQLIPASANASDKVRNMVESHMLERSKYENKLPTIELKAAPKSTPISSHLQYSYIEQASGETRLENTNTVSRYYSFKPQWLKQRAIRTESPVDTVLEPQNDVDREIIRQVINHKNIDSLPILYELENDQFYSGREDLSKIFTKTYKLESDKLIVVENTINVTNIQNYSVQGRFIFANEIEASSSSDQVIPAKQKYNRTGNYKPTYEQVFVSGRTNNNKSFVELEGNVSGTTTVDVFGNVQRGLPERQVHKNIIVERFSAPGGPEINSRGYLDAAAEEFSVYNSLNYRNSRVRRILNSWLAESSSINSDYPSYHQVNKNVSYSQDPDTGNRSPDYDNWFIQHQIPQSDQQYSWITASLSASFSASAFISDYPNLSPSYEFVSSDKITTSDKTVNTASNTIQYNSYAGFTASNGAFSWPSWKQIRTYENPISLLARKNNKISVQDEPITTNQIVNGVVRPIAPTSKSQTFKTYREPPVEYNKPIQQNINNVGSGVPLETISTYDNNKNYFANEDLNTRLSLNPKNQLQAYDVLKTIEIQGIYKPTPKTISLKYSSQIFPQNKLAGLADIRTKPNYDDDAGNISSVVSTRTFWRDDIDNRARSVEAKDIYDFAINDYSILPKNKILIPSNDDQNDVFEISGANSFIDSIHALDAYTNKVSGNYFYTTPAALNYVSLLNNNKYKKLYFGVNNYVNDIFSGSDGVYFVGDFTTASYDPKDYYPYTNNIPSFSRVARWDGAKWQPAGSVDSDAFCVGGGGPEGIYVGGNFTTVNNGATPANYIALYDGFAFSALGTGLAGGNPTVIVSGSDGVYVGGSFTSAGGSSANYIAKWNGSAWSALGTPTNGTSATVEAICSSSNGLYVGGYFNNAGSVTNVNGIAFWNGTTWSALGGGLGSVVYSIVSSSNVVYAAGSFNSPSSGSRVSQWNGSTWSPLGGGLAGTIYSLASSSDGLYAVGNFSDSSGSYISRWDGKKWNSVGYGLDGLPNIIISANEGYYIGGDFTNTLSRYVNNFIYNKYVKGNLKNNSLFEQEYNIKNSIFYPIEHISLYDKKENNIYNIRKELNNSGKEIDSNVSDPYILSSFSGSDGLYIAGTFTKAGDVSAKNVAKWDGTNWHNLGGGLNIIVNTITSGSDGVYAGGLFFVTGNNIAKWDGTNWNALASGLGGSVYSIVSGTSAVYAAGGFVGASGSNISRWNGTNWAPLTGGGLNATVYTLYSGSQYIYAGGYFSGGLSGSHVSRWNGSTWSKLNGLLGEGVDGPVYALISASDGIYVGGDFTTVDSTNVETRNIAKWDGSSWLNVGDTYPVGLNGIVRSLYSSSDGIYIGGDFTSDANDEKVLNNVAKWDGSKFIPIGASSYRNGFNTYYTDTVYSFSGNPSTSEIYIVGNYLGTRSGIKILDSNYNYQTEGFYTDNNKLLMPNPQLTFNNFIPPSVATDMFIPDQNIAGTHSIAIINENYVYETDVVSGKKPFFDSYDAFAEDLKPQSQKYSIVPEYTISDYIKTYVKEKNGQFTLPLEQDYLKLDGALQEQGFENINDSINIGSNLNNNLAFDDYRNISSSNLTLNISGIKKLLPYRGFYPSERIVQLGSDFINSFLNLDTKLTSVLNPDLVFSSSLSNGTPINQQILTLLQPIMAPGILLNTIKSSIAVDWPAFIVNSGSYDSTVKPDFYANTGSELVYEYVKNNVTDEYVPYTASNYINQEFNYRFPFESIIEFDKIEQDLVKDENNLYYLNATYYTSDVVTGSESHLFAYPSYNMGTGSLKPFVFQDDNYKLGMHNFLAEIPNFFLNGKLTSVVSLPESKFKAARKGVTYYMDVVLEKDSKYKEFIADPYYEALKKQNVYHSDGTLLLPSPDSLYGPPTRYWSDTNPASLFYRGPYNFYSKLFDTPAYAPYVPPYYYGKSIARISFTASENRKYTLAEIQASASVEFINKEAEELFKQRSNFINGNFAAPYSDNYSHSPAYKQMMTLSSSLNLFGEADQKTVTYDLNTNRAIQAVDKSDPLWVIQTKFETPSINFNEVDTTNNLGLKLLGGEPDNGIYSYMFKGMWTTYGQPVKNGQGIKMYIQQSYPKKNPLTGSLMDLCGFTNDADKKTIGLLAEKKVINEGVIVIPYTFGADYTGARNKYAEIIPEILGENGVYRESQTGRGPYYYSIDKNVISSILDITFDRSSYEQVKAAAEASKNKNNSIVKLINSMTKYVIPPHLDWLRNRSIPPFVMYIADFSTDLDRDDLSDIWQGVMPKQSRIAAIEDITISHAFDRQELFHGLKPLNDTKYKIFKVKQRANINYYKLTTNSKDDERFKFKFNNEQPVPEYSYNWPYDYFSLVELVKVEANITTSGSGTQ